MSKYKSLTRMRVHNFSPWVIRATYAKYLTCLMISASRAKIFLCAANESYLLAGLPEQRMRNNGCKHPRWRHKMDESEDEELLLLVLLLRRRRESPSTLTSIESSDMDKAIAYETTGLSLWLFP